MRFFPFSLSLFFAALLFGCQTVPPSASDMETLLERGSFAVLSAGRNERDVEDRLLTDVDIEKREGKLRAELKEKGFDAWPMTGLFDGQKETSFLVPMPCVRDSYPLISLGERYRQQGIIITRGGHNALVQTFGGDKGKAFVGKGWEKPVTLTEDHSRIRTSDGKDFAFRLHFDFKKLQPYTVPKVKNETACITD